MENNFSILNFNKENNRFQFHLDDKIIELSIDKLNSRNLHAELGDAFIFKLESKSNIAVYEENEKIIISFSKDNFEIQSLNLKLHNVIDCAHNLNYAIIYLQEDKTLKLQAIDCKIKSYCDGSLTILCNNNNSKIELFSEGSFSTLTAAVADDPIPDPPVSILSLTDTFVISGSRGPEFSLLVCDDYTDGVHSRPRPVRLGVPVISTVPVYSPNLSEEELTYYSEGKGPSLKKMFFRVVCNQELPDASVKLLIYLPNGVDTVTDPDYIDLVKISEAGENSVFHGEYVFYEEDTVYSVDGFGYFAIYTDVIQQVSLPIQIDELPTTYQLFAPPNTEIELF